MSRHLVDLTAEYEGRQDLDPERWIENPQIEPVPEENPGQISVQREPYLPDPKLKENVNLAIALGRPLLLQGDPGCGKTRLAYAVAYELGLPLEECYIKSTSRAQDLLYSYDAVNRLYDAQLGSDCPKDAQGRPKSSDPRNYIRLGPLGRAIARAQSGRRSVVLIDEIDKADLDFPNDLLYELDRLEFRVNEAPDMHYQVSADQPRLRPIVFVTHNEEKALPTPFLRRCIYHWLEMPDKQEDLLKILAAHQLNDQALNERAVQVYRRVRELELEKPPGLSELIDWVGYLDAAKEAERPQEPLEKVPYRGVLVKLRPDQNRVSKGMNS